MALHNRPWPTRPRNRAIFGRRHAAPAFLGGGEGGAQVALAGDALHGHLLGHRAKDDRRDARVLASALRTDPHCLRRLEPTDPEIIELREWSRLDEDLTRERVRLVNRMRQQLWRYYPQFLDAVDDDVAAPWALNLWQNLPTPRSAPEAETLVRDAIERVRWTLQALAASRTAADLDRSLDNVIAGFQGQAVRLEGR